jgi:hypothetical protein
MEPKNLKERGKGKSHIINKPQHCTLRMTYTDVLRNTTESTKSAA